MGKESVHFAEELTQVPISRSATRKSGNTSRNSLKRVSMNTELESSYYESDRDMSSYQRSGSLKRPSFLDEVVDTMGHEQSEMSTSHFAADSSDIFSPPSRKDATKVSSSKGKKSWRQQFQEKRSSSKENKQEKKQSSQGILQTECI